MQGITNILIIFEIFIVFTLLCVCAFLNLTIIFNLLGKYLETCFKMMKSVHCLVRPSLRTTLNNLGCALLFTNLIFGCSFFILYLLHILNILDVEFLCFSVVVIPKIYRIFSFYTLIGNLFLRGLLVKHAKYISVESNMNTLMVSDFGLPVWISIITFSSLHILYLCLNVDFPYDFQPVRLCTGSEAAAEHPENIYKLFLTMITGLILSTGFVLVSHLQIFNFRNNHKVLMKKQLRQNINTVQQVLAAAYIKIFCSAFSLSVIICSLMTVQSVYPDIFTPRVTQTADIIFISVECVLVPGYLFWETGRNFPELTSSRNNILGRYCLSGVEPVTSVNTGHSAERPLSPRRPNIRDLPHSQSQLSILTHNHIVTISKMVETNIRIIGDMPDVSSSE